MLIQSIHDIFHIEDYIILKFLPNLYVGTVEKIFLLFYFSYYIVVGDRGSTVVKVLCYKSEGRWFDPSWCQWNFFIDIKYFRSHNGPGVDSASNRNEYQEYSLGVKVAGAYG